MSSASARRILRVDDLADDEVAWLLHRAGELADGASPRRSEGVLGLAMLENSLRTRTGFASAAHRLGLGVVQVDARRASEVSMPESVGDTVRALSGYVDALVVRAPVSTQESSTAARPGIPWLNAGDRGPDAEHPSQALIDMFAMERLAGPIGSLHVAVCGDLRMRAARSLLALLARRQPARLSVLSDASLEDGGEIPAPLESIVARPDRAALRDVDVIVAVGIPHGATTEAVRSALRVDAALLAAVPHHAIVLSPMPIIDEIATPARRDPRMRFFEQSDLGLPMRLALLELLTAS